MIGRLVIWQNTRQRQNYSLSLLMRIMQRTDIVVQIGDPGVGVYVQRMISMQNVHWHRISEKIMDQFDVIMRYWKIVVNINNMTILGKTSAKKYVNRSENPLHWVLFHDMIKKTRVKEMLRS